MIYFGFLLYDRCYYLPFFDRDKKFALNICLFKNKGELSTIKRSDYL